VISSHENWEDNVPYIIPALILKACAVIITVVKRHLLVLALLAPPIAARGQISFDQLTAAAERMCKDAPLESKGSKTELSANAKVEINPFLKWIAGAGGSIGATRSQQETFGVLQEQLAMSIASGNDCRRAVLGMFKDKVEYSRTRPDLSPDKNQKATPQTIPIAQPISEAGLAIGDTMQKIKSSGLQGQFGTTLDQKVTFTTPLAIPLSVPNGYASYAQGSATFIFISSVVKAIVVSAFDQLNNCPQSAMASSIFSSTIRDMGEPSEPPQNSTNQEMIDNLPYGVESVNYKFSDNAEVRVLRMLNATAMNMSILKRCVVRVLRARSEDARSLGL